VFFFKGDNFDENKAFVMAAKLFKRQAKFWQDSSKIIIDRNICFSKYEAQDARID
jgi:hypothetical protein